MSDAQPQWLLDGRRRLGLRIRDARMHADLTQEELAHLSGVPRNSYQRIEHGISDAKFSHLMRIARALKLPVRDLLP